MLARPLARRRLDKGSLHQGIEIGHATKAQLGLHQGKAGPGLQETLGILRLELSLEDHLAQGWVQFDRGNLADVDPAITDNGASPEPGIAICDKGKGTHQRLGLLPVFKQFAIAMTGGGVGKLDAATQQGSQIARLDAHPVQTDMSIDGRLLPELGLIADEGGIDGIYLKADPHLALTYPELAHLARLQPEIEHWCAKRDAVGLACRQPPGLGLGLGRAKQCQLFIGIEQVDTRPLTGLYQLDTAREPAGGRAGFHLDATEIGLDLQRGGAIETGTIEQPLVLIFNGQLDLGITAGIQGKGANAAHRQPLVPDGSPFAQTGQILGVERQCLAGCCLFGAQ